MPLQDPHLDDRRHSAHHHPVAGDDLFFVARNGCIWACWLSGNPAVNLGSEAEASLAMKQFLGAARQAPAALKAPTVIDPPAPVPPPAPSLAAESDRSVWDSVEPRYIDPALNPPPPSSRTLKERASDRHDLTIIGRMYTARGSRNVTILDLSETGCQIHDTGGQLKREDRVSVKLGPVGPVDSTIRWTREDRIGIQFNTPLYPAVLEHIRGHFDLRRR